MTLDGVYWFWLIEPLGLLVLILILCDAVNRVFLCNWSKPKSRDGRKLLATGCQPERVLRLRLPMSADDRKLYHPIGMNEIRGKKSVDVLVQEARHSKLGGVLLEEFERELTYPAVIARKLELLEALNTHASPSFRICIESMIEPLYFLSARYQEEFENRHRLGIDVDRWAFALEKFSRFREPTPIDEPSDRRASDSPGLDALREEISGCEFLKERKQDELLEPDAARLTRAQVVDIVLDMARSHYRNLWTMCSTEEKVLLFRIAREGYANRNAERILAPLILRGLARVDPSCRLMNDSFRKFVLTAEPPEVIARWQRRGGVSAWGRMRAPILLAVITLAVFFFSTQQTAFHNSLALVAGLAASSPALLSLLGGLLKFGRGDAPKD